MNTEVTTATQTVLANNVIEELKDQAQEMQEIYYDVTDKNGPKYWEHYFAREIDTMCGQAMENFITKPDLNSILCSGLVFIGSVSKNSYCKEVNFHWLTNQGGL